jgi:hypothetical protein
VEISDFELSFRDWYLYKYKSKMLYNICPVPCSFHDTRHRQVAQVLKSSNQRGLKDTAGFRRGLLPFQSRWQCATWHSLEHASTCWHRSLSQLLKLLPRDFPWSWERYTLAFYACSWLKTGYALHIGFIDHLYTPLGLYITDHWHTD